MARRRRDYQKENILNSTFFIEIAGDAKNPPPLRSKQVEAEHRPTACVAHCTTANEGTVQ